MRAEIATQIERLQKQSPPGVNVTRTDAIASLIMLGAAVEAALDDPLLQDESGFRYFSARQLIAAGEGVFRQRMEDLRKLNEVAERDDGETE